MYVHNHQNFQNISRLEASIDKYSRQLDDQKKIIVEWETKYNNLLEDLQKLRQEMQERKGHEMLEMYMRNKDLERKVLYQDQGQLHTTKTMILMKNELDNMKNALLLSCEIIQQNYLLMRANKYTMDVNMKQKYQKLVKLVEGKANIKFADEDQEDSFESLSKIRALDFGMGIGVIGGKRLQEADDVINRNPAKRKKLIMDDGVPPVPLFAPSDPNATQILSGIEPLEIATNGPEGGLGAEINHTFRVPSVLTEQKNNVPGPSVHLAKNFKLKSSPKRFNKVTSNENKRTSPYRMKKSPKTIRKYAPVNKGTNWCFQDSKRMF